MEEIIGKVIRIDLDIYVIQTKKEIIQAKARGNTKKKGSILVGDVVCLEKAGQDFMITSVRNRQNSLIRPPVSNIDQMIIVTSLATPVPDYILLDKQIVLCMSKGINPVICINKIDLENANEQSKLDLEYIKNTYSNLGIEILFVSAKEKVGLDELKRVLKGKTSAFSGNSGVGKSSITSELIGEDVLVGDIGQKSNRGKHTTKSVNIYSIDEDTFILDTPGFSSYELYDIEYRDLKDFYPEFKSCHCDYSDCAHVIEDNSVCDVKRKLNEGKIDQGRYDRYVYIYEKLKEQYDRRYK
ncbi:MAG: ribosome small subunit-dependent GTPase A [Clostridia bacterium]|jgi:ribosome biogenesis GTPase|nr:ribosome small subunit-dependent GTPase A [Clostridia bacterium]